MSAMARGQWSTHTAKPKIDDVQTIESVYRNQQPFPGYNSPRRLGKLRGSQLTVHFEALIYMSLQFALITLTTNILVNIKKVVHFIYE